MDPRSQTTQELTDRAKNLRQAQFAAFEQRRSLDTIQAELRAIEVEMNLRFRNPDREIEEFCEACGGYLGDPDIAHCLKHSP